MKIRLHFVSNQCKNHCNFKGFTNFLATLCLLTNNILFIACNFQALYINYILFLWPLLYDRFNKMCYTCYHHIWNVNNDLQRHLFLFLKRLLMKIWCRILKNCPGRFVSDNVEFISYVTMNTTRSDFDI